VYTPYSQIKYINKSLFVFAAPYTLADAMNSSGSQSIQVIPLTRIELHCFPVFLNFLFMIAGKKRKD